MSDSAPLATLLAALTAVPPYDNPMLPVYEALSREQPALSGSTELSLSKRPLTLQNIRQHTQLLHDHADQMQRQMWAIHKVVQSCQQISPPHYPFSPWAFRPISHIADARWPLS